MILLLTLLACVGDGAIKDSPTDTEAARALSDLSGSSSTECLSSPIEGCEGGDAIGTLSVVNDGVELGPWTGNACEMESGAVSVFLLNACVPSETALWLLFLDLSFGIHDGDDLSAMAVGEGEIADGDILDAFGQTTNGEGVWQVTDGTGSLAHDPRGSRALAGSLEIVADIALEISFDVSW